MNEFYQMKLIEYTPKTQDIIKYIDIRLPKDGREQFFNILTTHLN